MNPFFSFDDDEFFGDLLLMGAASGGGKVVEDTATGNPLTFQTDLARPLKSLLIPFTPVQSGTGDPSPQNVRPIVPWDGLKVWHGGKNLYDKETYPIIAEKWINGSTGIVVDNSPAWSCTPFVPCDEIAGRTVTLNKRPHGNLPGFAFYTGQSSQYFISGESNGNATKNTPWTIEVPANAKYMRFTVEPGTTDIQIELGSSATTYEPYKPITETDISFPSPVYGGTLDVVSGVLTVEWAKDTLTGEKVIAYGTTGNTGAHYVGFDLENVSDNQIGNAYCDKYKPVSAVPSSTDTSCRLASSGTKVYLYDPSFTDEATAKSILNNSPVSFVYKLATPQEITLTPEQITAIVGENTIWSDADGSMTAVYLKKG